MLPRFTGPKARAGIAIKFDKNLDRLVEFAREWREQSRCELHLTHVEEAWEGLPWLMALDRKDLPKESLATAIDYEHQHLEQRLFDLAKKLGDGKTPASHNTVYSRESIAAGILADAMSHKVSMLLAGYDPVTSPAERTGKATAINLALSSSVPVLMAPLQSPRLFKHPKPRLLVCDDFTVGSQDAVHTGFEIAESVQATDVYHLHVARIDKGDFEGQSHAMVESIVSHMKKSGQDASGIFLLKKVIDKLERTLDERSDAHQVLLGEKGIAYHPEIRYGSPLKEIRQLADQVDADLVVFGRHEDLHHTPFAVGRVPMEMMLTLDRPVLVVPVQQKIGRKLV